MSPAQFDAGLKAILDHHGFGFQYAVLKKCLELFQHDQDSPWGLEVAELPVETKDASTHIDFVLRTENAMLIAECKRVDPAVSQWGFVRAPFTQKTSQRYQSKRPKVDQVAFDSSAGRLFATPGTISGGASYHIGKEIRTQLKGDGTAKGRGAIDDAIAQILRGRAGFIEYLGTHQRVLAPNAPTVIVPAIFTTAKLVTSDVDLGTANLQDGRLDEVPSTTPDWIWYEYNVPWSMRPRVQLRVDTPDSSLGRLLEVYHARSIAVVSVGGIEDFLRVSADAASSFSSL
ncbi:MAG TPA: hypothetical protein VI485_04870 [Vicinamibacterales bacterium]|nr:hypothetical protein [Vicinamibacterales bacterium]